MRAIRVAIATLWQRGLHSNRQDTASVRPAVRVRVLQQLRLARVVDEQAVITQPESGGEAVLF